MESPLQERVWFVEIAWLALFEFVLHFVRCVTVSPNQIIIIYYYYFMISDVQFFTCNSCGSTCSPLAG